MTYRFTLNLFLIIMEISKKYCLLLVHNILHDQIFICIFLNWPQKKKKYQVFKLSKFCHVYLFHFQGISCSICVGVAWLYHYLLSVATANWNFISLEQTCPCRWWFRPIVSKFVLNGLSLSFPCNYEKSFSCYECLNMLHWKTFIHFTLP